MNAAPEVQPLPYKHRNYFFYLLAAIFLVSLPFLFLYATGYRFSFGETTALISTGGMYVAAERTGAEIYIDNELVRETRVFRRAFYAQSIEPGTHRVHVQKEGHHTWVKELPVYAHIVTEAQAFNLPLVTKARVLSPLRNSNGVSVLQATSTLEIETTNDFTLSTSTATSSTVITDTEYVSLFGLFATTSASSTLTLLERVSTTLVPTTRATTSTTTDVLVATTTKETQGVRLFERDGGVYAQYVGERENMPYYYCAEDFELLGTSTEPLLDSPIVAQAANTADLLHPVQQVPDDAVCDQTIHIDSGEQEVIAFDFFPGGTDFVILTLESGVYVVEIDNRAWQNSQPLIMGEGLDTRVENGNVYVYDGVLIYHIQLEN